MRSFKITLFGLLVLCFAACNQHKKAEGIVFEHYVAYKGADTATVMIHKTKNVFKGTLEMRYNKKYKDSGDISGIVKGDTLIGQFLYKYYGVEWKRKPCAFLIKDKRLILGDGFVKNTLDVVHFDATMPINFDEDKQFVFYLQETVKAQL